MLAKSLKEFNLMIKEKSVTADNNNLLIHRIDPLARPMFSNSPSSFEWLLI